MSHPSKIIIQSLKPFHEKNREGKRENIDVEGALWRVGGWGGAEFLSLTTLLPRQLTSQGLILSGFASSPQVYSLWWVTRGGLCERGATLLCWLYKKKLETFRLIFEV